MLIIERTPFEKGASLIINYKLLYEYHGYSGRAKKKAVINFFTTAFELSSVFCFAVDAE